VIACLDATYRAGETSVACVLARSWADSVPAAEIVRILPESAPYQSGEFYRRELPALLSVLSGLSCDLEAVVIDGYVWLDSLKKPGLGAHLHSALGGQTPVVGVAKTLFVGAPALPVLRGKSRSPLFITSVGIPDSKAAELVRQMHGSYRLPTLLKKVDHLSRNRVSRSATESAT
jgi:deoxyribonuclease V